MKILITEKIAADSVAYLIDSPVEPVIIERLRSIEGVLRVSVLNFYNP